MGWSNTLFYSAHQPGSNELLLEGIGQSRNFYVHWSLPKMYRILEKVRCSYAAEHGRTGVQYIILLTGPVRIGICIIFGQFESKNFVLIFEVFIFKLHYANVFVKTLCAATQR